MRKSLLVLALLSSIGCNGIHRLIDGSNNPAPYTNINPNDYHITGTTSIVNDVVHFEVKGHTVTVEVKRPTDGDYVMLEPGYTKDYVLFTVPDQGVRFWNDSTPAGTPYRIHIVKQEGK